MLNVTSGTSVAMRWELELGFCPMWIFIEVSLGNDTCASAVENNAARRKMKGMIFLSMFFEFQCMGGRLF